MSRDAVVEIDLEWKSKGNTQIRSFKGTIDEIAKSVKTLDTSKFHKGLKVTQQDLNQMSGSIKKNSNLFQTTFQNRINTNNLGNFGGCLMRDKGKRFQTRGQMCHIGDIVDPVKRCLLQNYTFIQRSLFPIFISLYL